MKANHNITTTLFDPQTLSWAGACPREGPLGDFREASRRPTMETLLLPGRRIPRRLVHPKTGPATSSPWPSGTSRTSPTSTGSIHLAFNGDARLGKHMRDLRLTQA